MKKILGKKVLMSMLALLLVVPMAIGLTACGGGNRDRVAFAMREALLLEIQYGGGNSHIIIDDITIQQEYGIFNGNRVTFMQIAGFVHTQASRTEIIDGVFFHYRDGNGIRVWVVQSGSGTGELMHLNQAFDMGHIERTHLLEISRIHRASEVSVFGTNHVLTPTSIPVERETELRLLDYTGQSILGEYLEMKIISPVASSTIELIGGKWMLEAGDIPETFTILVQGVDIGAYFTINIVELTE